LISAIGRSKKAAGIRRIVARGSNVAWLGRPVGSLDTHGRDEVKARLEALIASFPDIHFSVDVEGWSDVDSLQLLQQLGLVPAVFPGPATPTT
jgi:hypothetical protein